MFSSVVRMCCEGSGRRGQEEGRPSDGLISGPAHFWALAGMAGFPEYFFLLLWRPVSLVQARDALHVAAMHRHMAKPEDWPYCRGSVRVCVLHAWLHRHSHADPLRCPNRLPSQGRRHGDAMASCAALPAVRVWVGVCGWVAAIALRAAGQTEARARKRRRQTHK